MAAWPWDAILQTHKTTCWFTGNTDKYVMAAYRMQNEMKPSFLAIDSGVSAAD
jgi:hypothetical protein